MQNQSDPALGADLVKDLLQGRPGDLDGHHPLLYANEGAVATVSWRGLVHGLAGDGTTQFAQE